MRKLLPTLALTIFIAPTAFGWGQLYDVPQGREIDCEYTYRTFDTVQQRLLQAGVRLAAVFNVIYG